MNIKQRIGGVRSQLAGLDKQAATYLAFLQRLIANGGKTVGVSEEPPPISNKAMAAIEEEISQLGELAFGPPGPPAHLYQAYSAFGPKYAESNPRPSLMGERTGQSLSRDYTGIRIWVDHAQTYLNYVEGAADEI